MNNLSWMIYFAGVCDSTAFATGFLSCMLFIAVIGLTVAYIVGKSDPDDSECQSVGRVGKAGLKIAMPVWIVCVLLSWLLPSKETVYAIAASEMGEEVIKTPEAAKARQALNAWLDKQIGDVKPEKP